MAPVEPTEDELRRRRAEQERVEAINDGLRREIAIIVGTKAPMPTREYLRKCLRCDLRAIDLAVSSLMEAGSIEVETNVDGLRWRARFMLFGAWMPWTEWGDR